jgi:hypothetical protein
MIKRAQLVAALPSNRADIEQLSKLPDGYLAEPGVQPDVRQFIDDLIAESPK